MILEQITETMRRYFTQDDGDVEIAPPEGFATSPAFQSGSEVSERLRIAYETTMPELYFGVDPLPDWQAICGRVGSAGV